MNCLQHGISWEMKKEISQETGDLLIDIAHLADQLEHLGERYSEYNPGFTEWFSTVKNQVETMNGLVEEISRMFQPSEDNSLYNPLKAVRIDTSYVTKA